LTAKRLHKVALLALSSIDAALTVATGSFILDDSYPKSKLAKTVKGGAKSYNINGASIEEQPDKLVENIVSTSVS